MYITYEPQKKRTKLQEKKKRITGNVCVPFEVSHFSRTLFALHKIFLHFPRLILFFLHYLLRFPSLLVIFLSHSNLSTTGLIDFTLISRLFDHFFVFCCPLVSQAVFFFHFPHHHRLFSLFASIQFAMIFTCSGNKPCLLCFACILQAIFEATAHVYRTHSIECRAKWFRVTGIQQRYI